MRTETLDKRVRAFVGDTAVVDSLCAAALLRVLLPGPGLRLRRGGRPARPPPAVGRAAAEPPVLLPAQGTGRPVVRPPRRGPGLAARRLATGRPGDRGPHHPQWQPGVLDRWMEEEEVVVEHPRDPHKRVEAIASSRHIEISLDGVTLADSSRPVLLFETHMPTRFYVPRSDVRFDALEPSGNRSRCPYKGSAEEYWSVRDRSDAEHVAWSYAAPTRGRQGRRHGGLLQRDGRRHGRRRPAGAPRDGVQLACAPTGGRVMNEYYLPICHGHGESVRLVRLLRPSRWGAARPELTPGTRVAPNLRPGLTRDACRFQHEYGTRRPLRVQPPNSRSGCVSRRGAPRHARPRGSAVGATDRSPDPGETRTTSGTREGRREHGGTKDPYPAQGLRPRGH